MPNTACLAFDASLEQYATGPTDAALNLYDTDFTIEFWANQGAIDFRYLIAKADHDSWWKPWYIGNQYGTIRIGWTESYTQHESTFNPADYGFPPGTWFHVAWTYSATTHETNVWLNDIYALGPDVKPPHTNPSGFESDHPLTLGCAQSNTGDRRFFYDGRLDEVRFWTVERSGGEIIDYLYKQAAGDEPGLLACWRMNENGGLSVADVSPSGFDLAVSCGWSDTDLVALTDAGGGGGPVWAERVPKRWTGSAWVGTGLKQWDGGAWVPATLKGAE